MISDGKGDIDKITIGENTEIEKVFVIHKDDKTGKKVQEMIFPECVFSFEKTEDSYTGIVGNEGRYSPNVVFDRDCNFSYRFSCDSDIASVGEGGRVIILKNDTPYERDIVVTGTYVDEDGSPIGKSDSMTVHVSFSYPSPIINFSEGTTAENPLVLSSYLKEDKKYEVALKKINFYEGVDTVDFVLEGKGSFSNGVILFDTEKTGVQNVVLTATLKRNGVETTSDKLYISLKVIEPVFHFEETGSEIIGFVDDDNEYFCSYRIENNQYSNLGHVISCSSTLCTVDGDRIIVRSSNPVNGTIILTGSCVDEAGNSVGKSDVHEIVVKIESRPGIEFREGVSADSPKRISVYPDQMVNFDISYDTDVNFNKLTDTVEFRSDKGSISGNKFSITSGNPGIVNAVITGTVKRNGRFASDRKMYVELTVLEPSFNFTVSEKTVKGYAGEKSYCFITDSDYDIIPSKYRGGYCFSCENIPGCEISGNEITFISSSPIEKDVVVTGSLVNDSGVPFGTSDTMTIHFSIIAKENDLPVPSVKFVRNSVDLNLHLGQSGSFSGEITLSDFNADTDTVEYFIVSGSEYCSISGDRVSFSGNKAGSYSSELSVVLKRKEVVVSADRQIINFNVRDVFFRFVPKEANFDAVVGKDISITPNYVIDGNEHGFSHVMVCSGCREISGDTIIFENTEPGERTVSVIGGCVDENGSFIGGIDEFVIHFKVSENKSVKFMFTDRTPSARGLVNRDIVYSPQYSLMNNEANEYCAKITVDSILKKSEENGSFIFFSSSPFHGKIPVRGIAVDSTGAETGDEDIIFLDIDILENENSPFVKFSDRTTEQEPLIKRSTPGAGIEIPFSLIKNSIVDSSDIISCVSSDGAVSVVEDVSGSRRYSLAIPGKSTGIFNISVSAKLSRNSEFIMNDVLYIRLEIFDDEKDIPSFKFSEKETSVCGFTDDDIVCPLKYSIVPDSFSGSHVFSSVSNGRIDGDAAVFRSSRAVHDDVVVSGRCVDVSGNPYGNYDTMKIHLDINERDNIIFHFTERLPILKDLTNTDIIYNPVYEITGNCGKKYDVKITISSSLVKNENNNSFVFYSDIPVHEFIDVHGSVVDESGNEMGVSDNISLEVIIYDKMYPNKIPYARFSERTSSSSYSEHTVDKGIELCVPFSFIKENFIEETDDISLAVSGKGALSENSVVFGGNLEAGIYESVVTAVTKRRNSQYEYVEKSRDYFYIRVIVVDLPSFIFDKTHNAVSGKTNEEISFTPKFSIEGKSSGHRISCSGGIRIEGDSIIFMSSTPVDEYFDVTGFCIDENGNPVGHSDTFPVHVIIDENTEPKFVFTSRTPYAHGFVNEIVTGTAPFVIENNGNGKYHEKITVSSSYFTGREGSSLNFTSGEKVHEMVSVRGVSVDDAGVETGSSDTVFLDLLIGAKDSLSVRFAERSTSSDKIKMKGKLGSYENISFSLVKRNYNPGTDRIEVSSSEGYISGGNAVVLLDNPGLKNVVITVSAYRNNELVCTDYMYVEIDVMPMPVFKFIYDEISISGHIGSDISFYPSYETEGNDFGYSSEITCSEGRISGKSIIFNFDYPCEKNIVVSGRCVDDNGNTAGTGDTMMVHLKVNAQEPEISFTEKEHISEIDLRMSDSIPFSVNKDRNNNHFYEETDEIRFISSHGKISGNSLVLERPDTDRPYEHFGIDVTATVYRNGKPTGNQDVFHVDSTVCDVEFCFVSDFDSVTGMTGSPISYSPGYHTDIDYTHNSFGFSHVIECSGYGEVSGDTIVFKADKPVYKYIQVKGYYVDEKGNQIGKSDVMNVHLEITPAYPEVDLMWVDENDSVPDMKTDIGVEKMIPFKIKFKNFFMDLDYFKADSRKGSVSCGNIVYDVGSDGVTLLNSGTARGNVTVKSMKSGIQTIDLSVSNWRGYDYQNGRTWDPTKSVEHKFSCSLSVNELYFRFIEDNSNNSVVTFVHEEKLFPVSYEKINNGGGFGHVLSVYPEEIMHLYENSYFGGISIGSVAGDSVRFCHDYPVDTYFTIYGWCVDETGKKIGVGDEMTVHVNIQGIPEIEFKKGIEPLNPEWHSYLCLDETYRTNIAGKCTNHYFTEEDTYSFTATDGVISGDEYLIKIEKPGDRDVAVHGIAKRGDRIFSPDRYFRDNYYLHLEVREPEFIFHPLRYWWGYWHYHSDLVEGYTNDEIVYPCSYEIKYNRGGLNHIISCPGAERIEGDSVIFKSDIPKESDEGVNGVVVYKGNSSVGKEGFIKVHVKIEPGIPVMFFKNKSQVIDIDSGETKTADASVEISDNGKNFFPEICDTLKFTASDGTLSSNEGKNTANTLTYKADKVIADKSVDILVDSKIFRYYHNIGSYPSSDSMHIIFNIYAPRFIFTGKKPLVVEGHINENLKAVLTHRIEHNAGGFSYRLIGAPFDKGTDTISFTSREETTKIYHVAGNCIDIGGLRVGYNDEIEVRFVVKEPVPAVDFIPIDTLEFDLKEPGTRTLGITKSEFFDENVHRITYSSSEGTIDENGAISLNTMMAGERNVTVTLKVWNVDEVKYTDSMTFKAIVHNPCLVFDKKSDNVSGPLNGDITYSPAFHIEHNAYAKYTNYGISVSGNHQVIDAPDNQNNNGEQS